MKLHGCIYKHLDEIKAVLRKYYDRNEYHHKTLKAGVTRLSQGEYYFQGRGTRYNNTFEPYNDMVDKLYPIFIEYITTEYSVSHMQAFSNALDFSKYYAKLMLDARQSSWLLASRYSGEGSHDARCHAMEQAINSMLNIFLQYSGDSQHELSYKLHLKYLTRDIDLAISSKAA